MKKYLSTLILIAFIIPSISFASWWNPFSWFKKKVTQAPVVQVDSSAISKLETQKQVVPVLKKVSVPEVKKCRAETFIVTQISREIDGSMKGYFENVITSNAKLTDLEAIRQVLIIYKDEFISNPDPFGAYKDGNGQPIPYSFDELNLIDMAYTPLYDQYLGYLNGWISTIDKIIKDKKDNGCIDAKNLSDYGVSGPFMSRPLSSPSITTTIKERKQYEALQAQDRLKQKQAEDEYNRDVFCSNYQIEKSRLDSSSAQSGTLFSSSRSNAENVLRAKYAKCF